MLGLKFELTYQIRLRDLIIGRFFPRNLNLRNFLKFNGTTRHLELKYSKYTISSIINNIEFPVLRISPVDMKCEDSKILIDLQNNLTYIENLVVDESSKVTSSAQFDALIFSKVRKIFKTNNEFIAGPVATFNVRGNNYYHWLIETLPRIIDISYRKDIKLVTFGEQPSFVSETLKIAGLRMYHAKSSAIIVSELFLPQGRDGFKPNLYDLIRVRDFYFELFENYAREPSNFKIFISRRFSNRYNEYEEKIEKILIKNNFQIIYAERLGISEQVNLFSNAQTVVAFHGAGLSNQIFMPKGSLVVELATWDYWSPVYQHMSELLEHSYKLINLDQEFESNESLISLLGIN
jgi:hypothetical protein